MEDDTKRNFSEDCVVLTKDGVYRGHDGLIELTNRLREEMPADQDINPGLWRVLGDRGESAHKCATVATRKRRQAVAMCS